ncbi:MAG TPA: serine--tRNA ligase [Rhodospirillaceae bacterium]|nr:MAG: serine--tRNA ligase [Alphaproteobacteria bacterium GWF2_58_20]HAU29357.1 serine--tRNA ligase [Rhodospirillaceae bacterium]
MHDMRSIRENPTAFDSALARRGIAPLSPTLLELDAKRRAAQTAFQEMQARRNEASREIGQIKSQGGDASALMEEVAQLKVRMPELEAEDKSLGEELDGILTTTPNLLADDVPEGPDESHNKEVRCWGEPRAIENPKNHAELGEALGLMDFASAAKLAGARFTILKGALCQLERALGQFMLDLHTRKFGYTECSVPILVNDATMFGTGQLPKFAEDLFRTTDGRWLIPTAEVSLTNMVADSIIEESVLPLRVTALTPCFRAEAGAAGKDTHGMLRQHQFWKVEMVSITTPEQSCAEHERMTGAAEEVLKQLNIPFRTIVLCSGDTGFSANKTYDIEAWLPGQQRYREISSCSNCGDFQARRMKARFRKAGAKGGEFAHTLNGSGLAVGRTLIAVMENYQQPDGSIVVPEVLRSYMGGVEVIR